MRSHPWIAAILALTIIFIMIVTEIITSAKDAALLANDLRSTSDRIFETSQSVDEETLSELSFELDQLVERAENTRNQMWLLSMVNGGLGFVPVVGDSSGSALNMLDRTVVDLKAASSMLSSARALSNLVDEIAQQEGPGISVLSSMPTEFEIDSAAEGLREASDLLVLSDSLTEKMDSYTTQIGRLKRADEALREREASIKEMLSWSVSAVEALKAMSGLEEALEPLLILVESPEQNMLQALDATESIPEISDSVAAVADSLQIAVDTTPGVIASSRFGADLADLNIVVGGADNILTAVSKVLEALSAAVDNVSQAENGLLGADSGLLSGLQALQGHSDRLEEADQLLSATYVQLSDAEIRRPSLVSMSDLLRSVAGTGSEMTVLLRELSGVAETVMGVEEAQTYLIIGANADELRGSGGFAFGIWSMQIKQGQIISTEYQDIVALDDWARLALYPDAPILMRENMDAQKILMRDVEWSSEFKTVAELAEEIWHLGGREEPIDGVISMTQRALVELVSNLGSIEVAGEVVSGSEVMELLEIGTDVDGRQFADLVFKAVEAKLTTDLSSRQALSFFGTFISLLEQKDVLVHLFDREANDALIRVGMGSSTIVANGDRLAIVDSNIGWNKVDRNVSRSFRYSVDLRDAEAPKAQLEVEYTNSGNAPTDECATQLKKLFATYEEFTNGCYWNLMRVYIAAGSILESSDPLPLPVNSVYHLLGLGEPGEDTTRTGVDEGGNFLSGLFTVPPGESESTTINLALPVSIVEREGSVSRYSVSLIAQPGAGSRSAMVEILLPTGASIVASRPIPDGVVGDVVNYSMDLNADTLLEIEFTNE